MDVMIWGTGVYGADCTKYLRDDVRLLCYVESHTDRQTFLGKPVISGEEARRCAYDFVILANTHEAEIAEEFALPEDKTIRYRFDAGRFPDILKPWNFPLAEENPWLMEQYEKDNYREEIIDPRKRRCYLFFSSNGIYFPNERGVFRRVIQEGDRYEWENIARSREIQETAGKIIFVRDIFKQWYVAGINARLDSIDKLMEFLHERTDGYETITCGTSSGGYMSVLGGVMLHSEQVFDISGQWSLYEHFDHVKHDPLLRKYAKTPERSRYYDLRWLIRDSKELPQISYLWPAGSAHDVEQYALVRSMPQVLSFSFQQAQHGAAAYGENYPFRLTRSPEELRTLHQKYADTVISPQNFLRDTVPAIVFERWRRKHVRPS